MKLANLFKALCSVILILAAQVGAFAQVTTSAIAGIITDSNGEALIGANVVAVHVPSGTSYGTATDLDGSYRIPGMRVGGPYKVTVTYTGYSDQVKEGVYISLGTAAALNFQLAEQAVVLDDIVISGGRSDIFSSDRTGAATTINSATINSFPTLSRSINDFTRLTPQANGTSFGGQDNRLNNITVDGSMFNNSFGLAGQPGGRTGVSPISLDAIEEVQVNIAPYDVRQANFTGAGINAVTRSGTNEFQGSVYYFLQNQDLVGDKSRGTSVIATQFDRPQIGGRLSGPIIKNKLFFFVNAEQENESRPFSNLARPNASTPQGGLYTRVLQKDIDSLSQVLRDFGYETGPYQGYNFEIKAFKLTAKVDWNISQKHKASVRYTTLDSERDQIVSNSTSLGFGARSSNNSMSFQNSNYIQKESIQSVIGEINSIFSNKVSNNLILGFTYQNEDRASRGDFFPLVEIQSGGNNYITFGFEPFTPSNKLSYRTYQFQDNLSIYLKKHTLTAGVNLQRQEYINVFFPGSQGVFVYNSLADFYSDFQGFQDNPDRTAGVSLRRFQYRYSALPGGAEPVQPTRVWYGGLYLQDEWSARKNLKLTFGLRADMPAFDKTGYENSTVAAQTYRAEGENIKISTSKLPDPQLLISPRFGFNWDVKDNNKWQIRGGTGLFTGTPIFVWISNQIGNNGVLTGFEQIDGTTARPFSTNPGRYITNTALPSSFELAITDPKFKFLQIWRSNLATDAQLPLGIVATLDFIYSKNVNGYLYYNVNEREASATFSGPDNRPRYPGVGLSGNALNSAVRINNNTVNAVYLTNTDQGDNWSFTAQLQKRFNFGLSTSVAYTRSKTRDLMSAGSIAAGSYNGARSIRGNNNLDLAFSDNDLPERILATLSFRKEYLKFGATQFALVVEGAPQGRFSYTYSQDMNGDGVTGNDLIYVPRNKDEMLFLPITTGTNPNVTTVFTPQQQQDAFEAYINQDEYLKGRRGQYAERNGALIPWLWRADLSVIQEFFVKVGGKRNTLQVRADMRNFTNLLNEKWGAFRSLTQTSILTAAGVNANGIPQFRMATTGSGTSQKLVNSTYLYSPTISDVWQLQLGVRYIFN